jgi:hypothetical protein
MLGQCARPSANARTDVPGALLRIETEQEGLQNERRLRIRAPRGSRLLAAIFRFPALAVSSLALLLHELAPNSAKNGALSAPEERIEIHCAERVRPLQSRGRGAADQSSARQAPKALAAS